MARRSIADGEIALIKAMLARGLKNKDIQFFFNRPDRPVNTGRISTIKTDSYSNSQTIPAASDTELDAFIATFAQTRASIKGGSPGHGIAAIVRMMFGKNSDGGWCLKGGETEEHECKRNFDPKKLTSVVRAIAALSNNKGGYLFFGVSDDAYRVEGIDATFAETDIVQIVEKVKAHLSPTPSITAKDVIDFDGKKIGFVRVEKHPDRPVIVYRDGEGLNEGEILFRYAGQSARVKFGDLRAMLDDRDRRAQVALANAAGRLADVGTTNALILDTNKNVLEGENRSILIDENLVKSINFIKEGEFQENADAPALKLVGSVSAVAINAQTARQISREALFQERILEDFLTQAAVDQPIQYIIAGLAQSRKWIPVFYFVRRSGRTNADVVEEIRSMRISQKGKKKVLMERLEGKQSAFTRATTQSAKTIGTDIGRGLLPVPTEVATVASFANALTTVRTTEASLEALLSALRICRELADKADDGGAMGAVFKAACRVDELFFGKET
jgi:Putative DNA-binding domain